MIYRGQTNLFRCFLAAVFIGKLEKGPVWSTFRLFKLQINEWKSTLITLCHSIIRHASANMGGGAAGVGESLFSAQNEFVPE